MPKSFEANRPFCVNLLFSATDDNESILAEKWIIEVRVKSQEEINQKMRQTSQQFGNNPYILSEEMVISNLVQSSDQLLPPILKSLTKLLPTMSLS